jgi:hypothetical protein
MPSHAPEWATGEIDIKASADGALKDRLRTARIAETDAITVLRQRVQALPLDHSTIGELAKKDPQIDQAITRTLSRLPPAKAEYGANGRASVHVHLTLDQLWAELAELK